MLEFIICKDVDLGHEAELLAHEGVVVEGVALVARALVMREVDVRDRVTVDGPHDLGHGAAVGDEGVLSDGPTTNS